MNTHDIIVLAAIILLGVPFTTLVFFVCRRLREMHRLSKPSGYLFFTEEREAYMQLNDESAFDKGKIVLVVKKIKTKGGK